MKSRKLERTWDPSEVTQINTCTVGSYIEDILFFVTIQHYEGSDNNCEVLKSRIGIQSWLEELPNKQNLHFSPLVTQEYLLFLKYIKSQVHASKEKPS